MPGTLFNIPPLWVLSAKWAAHEIDCTLHGIQNHCGGACCKGNAYWPPKASGLGVCGNLTPTGCALGADKPVTCLLYPFRLINNRLVLHGRTLIPKAGYCAPCHHKGGKSIAENNHGNFTILFGAAVANKIVKNTKLGIDTHIRPPAWVIASLADEARWEAANATPPGRSQMAVLHIPQRKE